MPSKADRVKINNPALDKRVKLTEDQRKQIREEYAMGDISLNGLARKYHVSKRLISFIIHPDKALIAKQQYKERNKNGRYYNREKHSKAVAEYRRYKTLLLKKGVISEENDKR